jgi:hypothetical protein
MPGHATVPSTTHFRMNSRTYIRDAKQTVSATPWGTGPIPKRHFPLFKDTSPLGPAWRWRAAILKSDKTHYRLLVQLRSDKPNFKAWLAALIGSEWAVIGRLESHGHAGLHCHFQCIDSGISVGQIEPPNSISVPHWKAHHRRPNKVFSEDEAWYLARRFFREQTAGNGPLGI